MVWAPIDRLVLTWWNTSLTPPIPGARPSDNDRQFVVEHIKMLRQTLDFDILGLCEVSTEDLDSITQGLQDPNMKVVDQTDHTGQLKFDSAIIYNSNKLRVVNTHSFKDRFGELAYKAGVLVTFEEITTGLTLHVVISHWPSRRTAPEFASRRGKLAEFLFQSLRKLRAFYEQSEGATVNEDGVCHIVLMGDYNDDPFSEPMAHYLQATRDRELARSNDDFFYNPFWRCLGESAPMSIDTQGIGVCGTHYYRSGEFSKWFTFDQIIFSSSFLSDNAAVLDETHSRIVVSRDLRDLIVSSNSVFDHFPVMSSITLREEA